MKNNSCVHLFSSILIAKGALNSLILDPARNCYFSIPTAIAEVYKQLDGIESYKMMDVVNTDDTSLIDKIIEFGLENEFLFFSDLDSSYFPKASTTFDHYLPVTNVVWDLPDNFSLINFSKLVAKNLSSLYGHLEIRSFKRKLELPELESLLELFSKGDYLMGVVFSIPFVEGENIKSYQNLFSKFPKLGFISIHSGNHDDLYPIGSESAKGILVSKEDVINKTNCGCVHPSLFSNNLEHIRESMNFNSCLNRKISIDSEGNIKNCPSMAESYGNIRDTTLAEALEKPGFKKYWDINKDKIHVCKDCEFRYICTDCRAYVEDPDDILSKPLKCGYNPYTGEWSEWSTNPLKQKAIDYYGMREMLEGGGNESR